MIVCSNLLNRAFVIFFNILYSFPNRIDWNTLFSSVKLGQSFIGRILFVYISQVFSSKYCSTVLPVISLTMIIYDRLVVDNIFKLRNQNISHSHSESSVLEGFKDVDAKGGVVVLSRLNLFEHIIFLKN